MLREVIEELADLCGGHLGGIFQVVKGEIPADPEYVRAFGSDGIVPIGNFRLDLIY